MEELNGFQILTRNILYLIGWLINHLRYFINISSAQGSNIKSFYSPLFLLLIGLFFAFAALHIFKRILRKG